MQKREFNTDKMIELQLSSTSKGNQRKWMADDIYVKECFYYQGRFWKDNLVECIASEIGKALTNKIPVLEYGPALICENGRITEGCYSKNFCLPGEKFIPFQRLMESKNIHLDFRCDFKERYDFVIDNMEMITGLSCREYINTMILMDYLVGNEDRHFNNFGILYRSGQYRLGPLFDFGLGLFEHDDKYQDRPFKECLEIMESKPFSSDNELIMDYILKDWDPGLKHVDLTECMIPSPKAGSYIRNRFRHLGIGLEGVD